MSLSANIHAVTVIKSKICIIGISKTLLSIDLLLSRFRVHHRLPLLSVFVLSFSEARDLGNQHWLQTCVHAGTCCLFLFPLYSLLCLPLVVRFVLCLMCSWNCSLSLSYLCLPLSQDAQTRTDTAGLSPAILCLLSRPVGCCIFGWSPQPVCPLVAVRTALELPYISLYMFTCVISVWRLFFPKCSNKLCFTFESSLTPTHRCRTSQSDLIWASFAPLLYCDLSVWKKTETYIFI